MTKEKAEAQRRARLTRLTKAVKVNLKAYGYGAAKVAVMKMAKVESIAQLAREVGCARELLTLCLSVHRNRPSRNIRRALEVYLDLPRGGMDMVLAPLEELREKE